jgi:hypothetical protein|mmetsp:Transcript_11739/g.19359  ORF Transcript_11739/g.19359 Transcript_11739/m.19359 type:complete len:132 (+) Transcript_11739:551-946(+)
MFQIMSASRQTATSKESTQVLSQVLPTTVDAVVVPGSVVLVVDVVAPDVVIVATGKADVIVVVVALAVMLVAAADVLDLAAVIAELLLTMAVLGTIVVVPVPASPPMQPEEASLHAENDAMSGPTNQSSPN